MSSRRSIPRCTGGARLLHPPLVRAIVAGALLLGQAAPVRAADEPATVEALRRELEALRHEYERRLAELEARLAALESPGEAAPPEQDLAALRAAAREAADLPQDVEREPTTTGPMIGHERNLNRLNPEISATGDLLAFSRGAEQEFDLREVEVDLQATLDPFSRMKITLSFEEEGVEIEEGYLVYTGLARGLVLRGGKMRQTFGAINRFHLHAAPQVEYPRVLTTFFGEEGLAQTGLSVEWLFPRGWASANELTFQLTDGSDEAFGGGRFDDFVGLLHLKSFWDLSPATYLEWGLSGIAGGGGDGRGTRVWGTDLTLHWQPPARAKYREITWRSEVLLSRRDDPAGVRQGALGMYSYAEGLVRRNLLVGARYDWLEDPLDPARREWALAPYITWWQSEFVRFRLEYQRLARFDDDVDHRFTVQATWSAGPHKHEDY